MRGFDHATILVPVSTVSTRNAWHNDPPFVYKIWRKTPGGYFQENSVGVCFTLLETLTLFQTKICDFCYPISDLIKNLVHYFRTEDLEPVAWPERETSCYGTYTVGVNIKREMVLSPNDEEIASSKNIPNSRLECTNHTSFQTKMVEIDTIFQTKTAKKPYLLGPHIPM